MEQEFEEEFYGDAVEYIKSYNPDLTQEEYDFFWKELDKHPNQYTHFESYLGCPLENMNNDEEYTIQKGLIKTWATRWLEESKTEIQVPTKPTIKTITADDMNGKNEGTSGKLRGMVYSITDTFEEVYADKVYCSSCHREYEVEHNKPIRRCERCNGSGTVNKQEELKRDFKEMEVEDLPDEITKQPTRIKVKVFDPLVYSDEIKSIQPGEVINIVGKISKEKLRVKNNKDILEYFLILESLELVNKQEAVSEITPEEMTQLAEISKTNPLEKLSKSLAPQIFDMENIKKSIILQMVRGPDDYDGLTPRIHIILVGEPGVAKSQLANYAHKKMPRSIYGSGDNMSKAGLSSAMEKEELTGRWVARAGILCRANKSIVVIDEFDKLSKEDMAGLHTPMEKGESKITKAGTHITLKADCSILACCNPKNGSFLDITGYEAISTQVNIPTPILNRFDLIFLLKDKVDEVKDRKIIRAMMDKEVKAEISTDLFKKYIFYASQTKPTIPEEIRVTAEDIYVKLRNSSKTSKETKINPRTSRSILSLAVAAAKVRLASEVSMEDIHTAEEIMMSSFESMGFGHSLNQIDMASLYSPTSSKKIAVRTKVKELIKEKIVECKSKNEKADWEFIKPKLQELGYAERELDSVFTQLRKEGTLLGEEYKLIWNG